MNPKCFKDNPADMNGDCMQELIAYKMPVITSEIRRPSANPPKSKSKADTDQPSRTVRR